MCKNKELFDRSTCDEDTLDKKLELAYEKATQDGKPVEQDVRILEL